MKLYSYFRSSASFRVRIALALKGIAYETVSVHLAQGAQHAPDFANKSADKVVPVLELTDGTRLTQSMAIIEYLDDTQPGTKLLPTDALGRARVRALAQTVACEIHPLDNLRVLKYLMGPLGVDEEAKNVWYHHWIRNGLLAYEKQLAQGPGGRFSHGDTPGLADCCLVPQLFNAKRFGGTDLSDLPRTMAVFDACMALPAFQQAQPSACPDFEP